MHMEEIVWKKVDDNTRKRDQEYGNDILYDQNEMKLN